MDDHVGKIVQDCVRRFNNKRFEVQNALYERSLPANNQTYHGFEGIREIKMEEEFSGDRDQSEIQDILNKIGKNKPKRSQSCGGKVADKVITSSFGDSD